jgi:hypothetical protein
MRRLVAGNLVCMRLLTLCNRLCERPPRFDNQGELIGEVFKQL